MGKHKIEAGVIGGDKLEVETFIWLHGCCDWLRVQLIMRSDVAFFNLEIEDDLGILRDWLSSDLWPDVGLTVGEAWWAIDSSIVTSTQDLNGLIPASHDLRSSNCESSWETAGLSS